MDERLASSCSTAKKEMLHVVSLSENGGRVTGNSDKKIFVPKRVREDPCRERLLRYELVCCCTQRILPMHAELMCIVRTSLWSMCAVAHID
jgi:hypothetical protein